MLTWRGAALGIGLCVGFAAACGDDPAKRSAPGAEAGAAGQAGEPSSAGGGPAPGASGSGAGGEGGGAPRLRVELATYCQTIGESYAAWLSFCYGTDIYPEAEAAEFAADTETRCLAAAPEVEAGRLAFDGLAAGTCVETIDTTNCDGFTFVEGTVECRDVFSGLVGPGDPCYPGAAQHFSSARDECAQGYCDVSGQACPGECVALIEDDEACLTSQQCAADSFCAEGLCTPRPALGEVCSGDACPIDASCVSAPGATEGVCVARSQAGQPCDEAEPCSSGFQCLDGECRSKVATGESCTFRWNCAEGERCLDRDGEGRTCGEPGGSNVPCEQPADCVQDHYCGFAEPKLCLPRVALRAPCTAEGQCTLGAWCNLEIGECQAGGGEGESCLMNGFPSSAPHACIAGLRCMTNGECHTVGSEDGPCNTTNAVTCEEGLYCSRVDFTCQPPAEQGEPCNPYSVVSCSAGLACLCDDPACENYGGDPRVSDALHTCLPRRADGDPCWSTLECAIGSSCLGTPGECVPDPKPCLPE